MLHKIASATAGIGFFAVIIALGILPHPADLALAQGGYTYTQRYCAELGRQPRYYNVRDGQAAYNGGNSDSGWLIVQERGGHRVIDISYSVNPSGAWVKDKHTGAYGKFVPDANGNPQLIQRTSFLNVITYAPSVNGLHVKVEPGTPGAAEGMYMWVRSALVAYPRYDRNVTVAGGLYIRWAHMDWCR